MKTEHAAAEREPQKVVILDEHHGSGIFDPAVEYGADGVGWMTYSIVDWPARVSIHLATSGDNGKTWRYVQPLFKAHDDRLEYENEIRDVVWRYETSTIVFDPADHPERRWKVYAQRLFSIPPHAKGDSHWKEGWLEYRYAATPDGDWSDPIRQFGPPDKDCKVYINSLSNEIRDMLFYNELGSIAVDGVLYLSLDASPTASGLGEWEKRRVILLASRDHGVTWTYAGTLTDYQDAQHFGYVVFTATSLVQHGGKHFAFLTPAGNFNQANKGHDGIFVVEFEDLASAKLKRDTAGALLVSKTFRPYFGSGGMGDYDVGNTYGGVVVSQLDITSPPDIFKVYSTLEHILD